MVMASKCVKVIEFTIIDREVSSSSLIGATTLFLLAICLLCLEMTEKLLTGRGEGFMHQSKKDHMFQHF